jgi:anti-sigma factor RsiW
MNHKTGKQCEHILGNLSAYLDGELDAACCEKIEAHLQSGQDCRIVASTLKETIRLCQADSKEVKLPEAVRTRLFTKLGLDDERQEE